MMKAQELLTQIETMGIHVIAGVPDSTLKQFCDGLQTYAGDLKHYVTANEGAAVGVAVGSFLATGRPACVYMQNSGLGNIVNPYASLAHEDVYGIPMLFIIGWRGEPGVKDEPQHVFQGRITCELLELMEIPYTVIDKDTTAESMQKVLAEAVSILGKKRAYAIVVKKDTFESAEKYIWDNQNALNREQVLGKLLEIMDEDACIVSTTGKISRELYEQSKLIRGNHDALFMTVGGMGHASMIAFGIAKEQKNRQVYCIDGDGAALMHMGSLAFLATNAPDNFTHIVINNQAHESVGSMPTNCQQVNLAEVARSCGYKSVRRITTWEELEDIEKEFAGQTGPIFYEIMVSLGSRADLGRPKESAQNNRDSFMKFCL